MRLHVFQAILFLSATSALAASSTPDLLHSQQEETNVKVMKVDDSASPGASLSGTGGVAHSVEVSHKSSSLVASEGSGQTHPSASAKAKSEHGSSSMDSGHRRHKESSSSHTPHDHHHHSSGKHGYRHKHHRHHRFSKYAMFNNDVPARTVAKDILRGHTHPRIKDLTYIIKLARAFMNEHEENVKGALARFGEEHEEAHVHSHHDSGLHKGPRRKKDTSLGEHYAKSH